MLDANGLKRIFEKRVSNKNNDINLNGREEFHLNDLSSCMRYTYYNKIDPIDDKIVEKLLNIKFNTNTISNSSYHIYKIDTLVIYAHVDDIFDDVVVKVEFINNIPDNPLPRDIIYINACLFILKKFTGMLVYLDMNKNVRYFFITKNERMFDELIRRGKILKTLLEEKRAPVMEISSDCLKCKYYGRCYNRENNNTDNNSFVKNIFSK